MMFHQEFASVHGTAVFTPSSQLEAVFTQDRWDARNIPGIRLCPTYWELLHQIYLSS